MQRKVLAFNEEKKPKAPITLETLGTKPHKLIWQKNNMGNVRLSDDEYENIAECACANLHNRATLSQFDFNRQLGEAFNRQYIRQSNVPIGFNNPVDLFETMVAEYIFQQFKFQPEIHIASLGSAKLLHELVIIAKLIKLFKDNHVQEKPIFLHAIDEIYKLREGIKSLEESSWNKARVEFEKLLNKLNINVTLLTYVDINEYADTLKNSSQKTPHAFIDIDFPNQFAKDFPSKGFMNPFNVGNLEDFLKDIKKILPPQSIQMSLTHIDCNEGLYVIFQKKNEDKWEKSWIHTIAGVENSVPPSIAIENILSKYSQFSEITKYNQKIKEKSLHAPISYAVYCYDLKNIEILLKEGANINAQDDDGFTALHWAAMRKDEELIKKLQNYGADSTIKNKYGRTPADYFNYIVKPKDFKEFISQHSYQKLCKKYNFYYGSDKEKNPDVSMPEFQELYHTDKEKKWAVTNRNTIAECNTSFFNRSPTTIKKCREELNQAESSTMNFR